MDASDGGDGHAPEHTRELIKSASILLTFKSELFSRF